MDKIDEAALSARIGVLENVLALMIANMAVMTGDPAPRIETLRTTLWSWQPQAPEGRAESDPEMHAYRMSWEACLDRLFDQALQLAAAHEALDQDAPPAAGRQQPKR